MPATSVPIRPFGIALVRMTSELKLRIITVSMKGSNNAVIPSDAGSSVCTAEWAIDADPKPASLENKAR